jgi:hypothetical protein
LEEAIAILATLKICREGLLAFRILSKAVADRQVTIELVGQVFDVLRSAEEQAST